MLKRILILLSHSQESILIVCKKLGSSHVANIKYGIHSNVHVTCCVIFTTALKVEKKLQTVHNVVWHIRCMKHIFVKLWCYLIVKALLLLAKKKTACCQFLFPSCCLPLMLNPKFFCQYWSQETAVKQFENHWADSVFSRCWGPCIPHAHRWKKV